MGGTIPGIVGAITGLGSLASLVAEALTIRPGAAGWRNKTCGEPHGRLCADQWIFGHLIANTWNRFNISLDYERSIFYVASIHDWSYSTASMRIKETQPAVVHMPFIQAPRVNATLHALYAGHVIGRPPPEASQWVQSSPCQCPVTTSDRAHCRARGRYPGGKERPGQGSKRRREVARSAAPRATCYQDEALNMRRRRWRWRPAAARRGTR